MPATGASTAQHTDTGPRRRYGERRDAFEAARAEQSRRSLRLSALRVIAFAAALALGVMAELRPGPLPLTGAVLAAAVFIGLVIAHGRVRVEKRRLTTLRDLNDEGIRRIERAWDSLPARMQPGAEASHGYAEDLDLFGRPALTQLLGPSGTPAGDAALAGWLLRASTPEEVRRRQAAVRALADRVDLRDDLAAATRLHGTPAAADVDRFLEWAEDRPWLTGRPLVAAARWLLPVASVLLIAVDLAGAIDGALWLIPVAVSLILSLRPGARVRAEFGRAFGREGPLQAYPRLLELAGSMPQEDAALAALNARFVAAGVDAVTWMRRLARLEHLANLRFSTMIYGPVQILTLWDLHVAAALARWQREAGPHVREWLSALGELEALAALSTLAHDHPDWCWPELDASADRIDAESLGHPMIAESVRVANDVTVGPPGTFLLITGSNMSGKSTLLRAIGANAILAQAGAPVCARRLRMPPLRLATSIHVQDSLVQGTSYFMAQLQRMKHVVEAGTAEGPRLVYLLDEMLQGTNTAERRIAATRVIRHLLDAGAIGAVTTHDLELADEPEIADAVHAVHFTETVSRIDGRDLLAFDYLLRPGVATSSNALRLMEIVGLGGPPAPGPS